MKCSSIALIHPGKALLPELEVYQRFLCKNGYEVAILENPLPEVLEDFRIEWHFMGSDWRPKTPRRIKIHEYVSASVPPFARVKNALKKRCNVLPDARIFGDPLVKEEIGFRDNLPFLFRPAGVDASFFKAHPHPAEFDLVYSGAMDGVRNLIPWISHVLSGLPGARLLLVGQPSAAIWKAFKAHPGVVFSGKVPYADVSALLAKAEFGLNLIPGKYPFFIQAPLKLLEYCAVGLKVISTPTAWVRQFERDRQGRFFYLGEKSAALSWEQLRRFPFETPSVDDLVWDRLLESSGISALLGRLTE